MQFDVGNVVVACGGRDYADVELVRETLQEVQPTLLIHGGAKGADGLAGLAAHEMGVPVIVVPAMWDYYGKDAGPRRNAFQASLADSITTNDGMWKDQVTLLAFPGGRGTAGMVSIAKLRSWKVIEIS